MGWASAGGIFEPVARKLIKLDVSDHVKREVCSTLIATLQEGDWDTEGESLDVFADDPVIVQAFRENGVYLVACDAERDGERWASWCQLEDEHDGDHDDGCGHTWPRTGGNDA
jgi:hypothetical protein